MEKWLYSFTYSITDEKQERDSLLKLLTYIDISRAECNKPLIRASDKYIRESFIPDLGRLCFRHYCDIPHGGVASNSFSESYNSLRYKVGKVKANNTLHQTGNKLLQLSDSRFENVRAAVQRQQSTTQIANNGVVVNSAEAELSKTVLSYMCKKAMEQWSLGQNYHYFVVNDLPNISLSTNEYSSNATYTSKSTQQHELTSKIVRSPSKDVAIPMKRHSDDSPSGCYRKNQSSKVDATMNAGNTKHLQSNIEKPPGRCKSIIKLTFISSCDSFNTYFYVLLPALRRINLPVSEQPLFCRQVVSHAHQLEPGYMYDTLKLVINTIMRIQNTTRHTLLL